MLAASKNAASSTSDPIPHERKLSKYKIVLLGEGCVGKTSLILRYTNDTFNDSHNATIQASFAQKKIHLRSSGERVELNIFDTAGQERFRAISPIYYRNSDAAVIVFDSTDYDSFDKCKSWVTELRSILGVDIPLVVVANKIDLVEDRVVSRDDALKYVEQLNSQRLNYLVSKQNLSPGDIKPSVHLVEASAKDSIGVDEVFLTAADCIASARKSRDTVVDRDGSPATQSTVGLRKRPTVQKKGVIVLDQREDSVDTSLALRYPSLEERRRGTSGTTSKKCCS